MPGGGRGYIRTPSLTSIWATAPFLHNNSVGVFVKDPIGAGTHDGLQRRDREDAVARAPVGRAVDSGHDGRQLRARSAAPRRKVRIPAGTPVDYVARVDPTRLPDIIRNSSLLNFFSDEAIYRRMLRNNAAPDFVLDRGHVFGAGLSDADKWALD